MSDEQFQDFPPSQCVILQHQREEGGQGLAPWSWSIFWGSRCQMSNFKTFQPSQCVILQYQGGGEGVRGLAPWSWSTFWVSRCQMSNFKTLWSIKLHMTVQSGQAFQAPWSAMGNQDANFFEKFTLFWRECAFFCVENLRYFELTRMCFF